MIWIIIGMICTMQECHEVSIGEQFKDSFECQQRIDYLLPRTAMYFKLRCEQEYKPS